MGTSKSAFPRRLRPQNRDSTWANLGNALKCRCRVIECTWRDIEQPGAYVDLETGYLYRIPTEALQQRAAPLIRRESTSALSNFD